MLAAIVPIVLSLIEYINPAIAAASGIAKIISALEALIPAVIQEAKDLAPNVKHVIATLRGNPAIPADQIDQLDAIEAPLDAAFDTAANAATAEDEAAKSGA